MLEVKFIVRFLKKTFNTISIIGWATIILNIMILKIFSQLKI
jgi:hypothetical protein